MVQIIYKIFKTMKVLGFYCTCKLTNFKLTCYLSGILTENKRLLGPSEKALLFTVKCSSCLYLFPLPPSFIGQYGVARSEFHTCTWFISKIKNTEFREPESFTLGYKQTCLNFAIIEDIILYFFTLESK